MASFLKGLLRGSHSKHKKLLEDWALAGKDAESESDGIVGVSSESNSVKDGLGLRFHVKYLGSTLVDTPNGDVATADAIKAVIALAKASGKKLRRVILKVTLRGIQIFDAATEETQFDISLYRISYCSADATFSHVFAFIATNANETMECHAFLCRKRKIAQCATLAIANTFSAAYELWQLSHGEPGEEQSSNEGKSKLPTKTEFTSRNEDDAAGYQRKKVTNYTEITKMSENTSLLIDFSKEYENIPVKEKSWVSFEDDDDTDFERRSASKCEKKCGDIWGESYSSIDLLCLS